MKTGNPSAAGASSWVDGIDRFPQGGSVGFLLDTERRTLRGSRTSSCENRRQWSRVTPSHRGLHNQADIAADHTLTPLHSSDRRAPLPTELQKS